MATTHSKNEQKTPSEEKSSFVQRISPSGSPVQDQQLLTYDSTRHGPKDKLPYGWQLVMIILTCLCTFGNHWSNGLIVALKTTIIKELHINNSQFATLVAITSLVNTFLCIGFGFCIDKWGGPLLSVVMAGFHLSGAMVMSGASTNGLNSYPVLIVGKVLAAIGDGSLDNAQHRIFATYFSPGKGFAFSIGTIWGVANLAQFTGQSTANIITRNLGSYSWALWISTVIALFSFMCAIAVFFLDRYLRSRYDITDQTNGKRHIGAVKGGRAFRLSAIKHLPLSFWLVVLFAVFENAGVQSFVSISTQFAQQRLKKGAVIGGWVSSFYLLLPACLTPFIGIYIDMFGQRIFLQSVVQASIVIITTAAGKLQDDSATNSLDPAVTLWLSYAAVSVVISGFLLFAAYFLPTLLPATRLSQVTPRVLPEEVRKLSAREDVDLTRDENDDDETRTTKQEMHLKAPLPGQEKSRWMYMGISLLIIVLGWIMFGLGVGWGVHGNVIAGTTGE
ncbi:hypothetical protein EUX98_g9017 [Antrodiella citrinella]|uniref:Lysosomal dipeptide transporter MFSD1 n=1 Tax=Antrodiella citrinella TaxID=2447956 RepID=A0A4S4M199_9APHY|nr:hypothetical protein EUX98_g9017 [Antrodiella citrinella]